MPLLDTEAKRKQFKTFGTIAFIGVVCIVTAPLAFLALEGMVAWIAFGIVTALAANFAPAFGTWLSNKKLAALKAAVEANPIETLENLYAEKSEELQKTKQDIISFDGGIRDFKQQLKEVKAQYPDEAAEYDQMAVDEDAALASMKEQYDESAGELDNLSKDINKAHVLYKLAKTALRVTQLNTSQQAQVYQDIKKKVAFDTVQSTVNKSFAALNASVMARKNRGLSLPSSPKPDAPKDAALPAAPDAIPVTSVPKRALSQAARRNN